MRCFVYGTLKKGFGNNYLLEGSTFLGQAMTNKSYHMIDVGFPVLLTQGPALYPVNGEVYKIDQETLVNLDHLESEGRLYDRIADTVTMETGEEVRAYYYVGVPSRWAGRTGHAVVAPRLAALSWRPGRR